MTFSPDQVLGAAIVVAVVILVIVAILQVAQKRTGQNTHVFGAGGRTTVPVGTLGSVATALEPNGVIRAVGEQWTARSADGSTIPLGAAVRVVALDGLVLVVEEIPGATSGAAPDQG